MTTKNQSFNAELFDVVVITKDDDLPKMYHFDNFEKALSFHKEKTTKGYICKMYNRLATLLSIYDHISKLN